MAEENFELSVVRDPLPKGWRGWVQFLLQVPNTLTLRSAGRRGGLDVQVWMKGCRDPVLIKGYAREDGQLSLIVEHKGSPRLKWVSGG